MKFIPAIKSLQATTVRLADIEEQNSPAARSKRRKVDDSNWSLDFGTPVFQHPLSLTTQAVGDGARSIMKERVKKSGPRKTTAASARTFFGQYPPFFRSTETQPALTTMAQDGSSRARAW